MLIDVHAHIGRIAKDRREMLDAAELARSGGKLSCVERLVEGEGWSWRDVVAVGDDANNLELMRKAGLSIGFRPMYQVRKEARFIVDGASLRPVAELVRRPAGVGHEGAFFSGGQHRLALAPWRKELLRKLVHGLAAATPLVALLSPLMAPGLLIVATMLFLVSEVMRLNGVRFPVLAAITESVIRENERRELAVAPLTLVLGIGLAMVAFAPKVGNACIFIVAFADSAAAVVGERWGTLPIPYSRAKTVEGSLVFLVVSVVCAMVFLPAKLALVAGVTAALVESFDVREWDNLLVPLAAGIAIEAARVI